LVEAANTFSNNQARASQDHAEGLRQRMHGLIEKLGRNASSNLQNIAGALTTVVSDLARKVEQVSETMVRSVGNRLKVLALMAHKAAKGSF
jgi:phosphate uptake regulator